MKCSFDEIFFDTEEEMRDFLQHYIIAYLSHSDVLDFFQFKGGTMLRVCAKTNYRFSEDIDLEVVRNKKTH